MNDQSTRIVAAAALIATVFAGAAQAQRRTTMSADAPEYNPATEETIQGIVITVTSETEWAERGRVGLSPSLRRTRAFRLERVRMTGTHVLLDTPDGDLEVHVAPIRFLASNGFEIARHEPLEVVGSRITVNGEDMIVAREVTQDGRTLAVRESDGTPKWSQE